MGKGRGRRRNRRDNDTTTLEAAGGDLSAEQLAAIEDGEALEGVPWYANLDLEEEDRRLLIDVWQSYAMAALNGGAEGVTAAMEADVLMVEHLARVEGLATPAPTTAEVLPLNANEDQS